MKTKIISIILLILMVTGATVYASDVSGAVYQATIRVTNNSTATTNVAVPFTLNSQYLLDNGFVNSSFNNTAIIGIGGSDNAYMPGGNSTNPWIVYIPSIGQNSQINNTLYMGGGDMAAKLSYFPGTAGMTTSDAASLELGDNFTITLSDVFIDTTAGAGKYIFYKQAAIGVYIDPSTSGTVTAAIYEYDDSATWQSPTGASGTSWTDTAKVYDDNTGTYAYYSIGSLSWSGYLTMTNTAVITDRIRTYCQNQSDITQIDVDAYYSGGWHDIYSGAKTQGNWQTHVIGSFVTVSQVRIRLYNNNGGSASSGYFNECDLNVATSIVDVSSSVTSITTGEYDITISADTTNLEIDLSGTSDSTALAGASILDTSNNVISFENDTVLYAGSQEIEVDGVQVQYVEWEYGTTFTDSSGNSNDATPTFRTTSSDADVSAEMLDFEPYNLAEIGEYSIEEESYMIDSAPDEPDDLYDSTAEEDIEVPETLMPELWDELLAEATIPASFFWIMIAFCTAMAGGLIAYGGVTKLKGESVSFASADSFALFIQALVSGLILVIWIVATSGTVVPGWIMAPYVIIELAAILLVRRGVA